MEDRTCLKCDMVFKYPSYYKRHLQLSSRCKDINYNIIENQIQQTIESLESLQYLPEQVILNQTIPNQTLPEQITPEQEIIINELICQYCNKLFSRKSSLVRHQKETKRCTHNIPNPQNIQIQNITNNNNTNNNDNRIINNTNNNTNNITINNIIVPEIIYPFGYEDISFLNDSDMLEILKSPNGAIIAMEKVYSKLENRNFYKQNIGKDNITYIDKNFDKQIYKQKDFQNKLLFQAVEFMYRICFKCRERITLEDQIIIMKNINIIEKTLQMKDDVANVVSAMLERDFMNNSRREFIQNFNKKLETDKSFKEDKLKFLKEIRKELNRYYINKTSVRITDNLLKDEAWTKSEQNEDDVARDDICNNLNMYFINDTPRYKFFKEMKEEELTYLKDHGFTIADIRELIKIHSQRTRDEIAFIEETYSKERSDNIKETLTKIEEDEFIDGLENIDISNRAISTY